MNAFPFKTSFIFMTERLRTQPAILFLDVEEQDQSSVRERFPDAQFASGSLRGDALVAACADVDVLSIFVQTIFPQDVIDRLPRLRLLCTRSVGYDHIDLNACSARSITVCNVPDYGSHAIAEHVFALLLGTLRHVHEGDRRVEDGTFDYHGLRGMALKGKTIGIVGTGRIGRCVARIAHGFGMRILAADRCRTLELEELYGVRYVPLEELLSASDIVTLHIPGSTDTAHIIDGAALARMKKGAILVNTARGTLVDSDALLKELENEHLAYALLDVLEDEQDMHKHTALIHHPRVVTTPHIAFYADDSMRNMYLDCFQSIDEWLRGEKPAHAVQPVQVVCDLPPLEQAGASTKKH